MSTITNPEAAALAEVPAYNPPAPAAGSTSSIALLMDDRSMDKLMRMADMMATAKATVPAHFRNSPGDCLAVCMQAATWNMNPFAVAQKTHIVNGALGYEAQLVAAVINNSGAVQDRFHYEWFGEWRGVNGKSDKSHDRGVKIWATLKGETEPRDLTVTMAEAGVRNSPLWEQAPKIQLSYLAAKRWARLYAPDVILGVYTPDEFERPAPMEMGRADVVQSGASSELIERAETAAGQGVTSYKAFWASITPTDRKLLADDHQRLKAVAKKADEGRTVDASQVFPPIDEPARQPIGKSFSEVMQMLCEAATEEALIDIGKWLDRFSGDESELLDQKFDERMAQIRGAA